MCAYFFNLLLPFPLQLPPPLLLLLPPLLLLLLPLLLPLPPPLPPPLLLLAAAVAAGIRKLVLFYVLREMTAGRKGSWM